MGSSELIGGLLPDMATFLKGAGMAFRRWLSNSFDSIIWRKPLLSIQEGLQKGVYWPSMFLVGATLSMEHNYETWIWRD